MRESAEPAPKRLTEAERFAIVRDRLQGATLGELAERYGCSSEAIRKLLLKAQGCPNGRLSYRVDRRRDACAKRDQAVRDAAQGKATNVAHLEWLFGLPKATIKRALHRPARRAGRSGRPAGAQHLG